MRLIKSKYGKRLICSKCGKQVFLHRYDTGYTTKIYDPIPEGWKVGLDIILCPDCFEVFELVINAFLGKKVW
jgi:hypothetical protein